MRAIPIIPPVEIRAGRRPTEFERQLFLYRESTQRMESDANVDYANLGVEYQLARAKVAVRGVPCHLNDVGDYHGERRGIEVRIFRALEEPGPLVMFEGKLIRRFVPPSPWRLRMKRRGVVVLDTEDLSIDVVIDRAQAVEF